MKPRSFLFITPYYKPSYVYGGPVRSLSSMCEGLVRLGHRVTVLTTNANGGSNLDVATEVGVDVEGVEVRYYEQRRVRGRLFYSPGLARACRRLAPSMDLVYIFGVWTYPAIAASAACRKVGAPYVVSPRASLMAWPMRERSRLKKRTFYELFGRRHLECAEAIHYTSATEQEEAEPLGFSTPGFVVPNTVDLSEFENLPTRGAFRSKQGLPADAPLLLFLGRIEPRKGLDFTIEAFARTGMAADGSRLAIVGPSAQGHRAELERQVERLGLEQAVRFVDYLGPIERLEALVDADVFVLTSHTENFAMAAVEAMAAGLPVVLSEGVGVATEVRTHGGGRVTALDVNEISAAFTELLTSSATRAGIGTRAREVAFGLFDSRAVAARMAEHLIAVLDQRTAAVPSGR